MILVCDGVVNADDLELAEPEMILNNSNSIATYGMLDQYDSSGNGYDLVTGNEFTELGMRTAADSAHCANTGIIESDDMTFALCINMSKPTVSGRLFSNLFPGIAPFGGLQLRIEAAGTLILQVATGNSDESTVQVIHGGAIGGWTRFTVAVSNTEASITRASGDKHTSAISVRKKSPLPLILNGGQSPEQNMGLPGLFGLFAVYNRALTDSEQTDVCSKMKNIMAMRGVIIN